MPGNYYSGSSINSGHLLRPYYEKAARGMWYVTAYRGQHCAGLLTINQSMP